MLVYPVVPNQPNKHRRIKNYNEYIGYTRVSQNAEFIQGFIDFNTTIPKRIRGLKIILTDINGFTQRLFKQRIQRKITELDQYKTQEVPSEIVNQSHQLTRYYWLVQDNPKLLPGFIQYKTSKVHRHMYYLTALLDRPGIQNELIFKEVDTWNLLNPSNQYKF